MKMPRKMREQASLVTKMLDEMNIEWKVDVSHKHPRLLYFIDGKLFIQVFSRSASDKRSSLNMKSDICKTIRQQRGNE